MTTRARFNVRSGLVALILWGAFTLAHGADTQPAPDPLPSWQDGVAKQRIVSFVSRVVETGGADYVDVPARIAVFDNDGTLWGEQPFYVRLAFAFDRVKALAPQHPDQAAGPSLMG